MSFLLGLFDFAGFAALLLWGVHMVQSGVERAFGDRLQVFLSRRLRHPISAFSAGLAVTAALQSSTATGLMVASFVATRMIDLACGLAIMLGANVGSTLIVQLLTFPVSNAAPFFILAGVIMFRRTQRAWRNFGRVLIGLALILLALKNLVDGALPYAHSPVALFLLQQLSEQWLAGLLIGIICSWVFHSSVAVVLLAVSFAVQGTLGPTAAAAIVLGANLGSALNPVFEGASATSLTARRLAVGNLMIRVAGVLTVVPWLPFISRFLSELDPAPARLLANLNTVLNVAIAVVLLPACRQIAQGLHRFMPDGPQPPDLVTPRFLEPLANVAPSTALSAAAREAARLSEIFGTMAEDVRDALCARRFDRIVEARRMDDVLDRLNSAIKLYVSQIDPTEFTEHDRLRAYQILAFTTHIEQAGDLIDKNLLPLALKRRRRAIELNEDDLNSVANVFERLLVNTRSATTLFLAGDHRGATRLASEADTFREIEEEFADKLLERIRVDDGRSATLMLVDVIHYVRRINSHLIEGVAYPLLRAV